MQGLFLIYPVLKKSSLYSQHSRKNSSSFFLLLIDSPEQCPQPTRSKLDLLMMKREVQYMKHDVCRLSKYVCHHICLFDNMLEFYVLHVEAECISLMTSNCYGLFFLFGLWCCQLLVWSHFRALHSAIGTEPKSRSLVSAKSGFYQSF